jgi:hypothetical protein
MISTRYLVIACCLALGACSSETTPPPAADPTATAPAAAEAAPTAAVEMIESVSSDKFSIAPSSLTQCEPASEVAVAWNFPELPATTKLELYVNSDGTDKLFAASGNVDSAKTGPWARPGTRFLLKSEDTKEVVAEAVVGGPRC